MRLCKVIVKIDNYFSEQFHSAHQLQSSADREEQEFKCTCGNEIKIFNKETMFLWAVISGVSDLGCSLDNIFRSA